MTHDAIQISSRNHLLLMLQDSCITNRDDLIDALQFHTDFAYPMHFTTRTIANSIRLNENYYSDSTVNDLLHILDDINEDADA